MKTSLILGVIALLLAGGIAFTFTVQWAPAPAVEAPDTTDDVVDLPQDVTLAQDVTPVSPLLP